MSEHDLIKQTKNETLPATKNFLQNEPSDIRKQISFLKRLGYGL